MNNAGQLVAHMEFTYQNQKIGEGNFTLAFAANVQISDQAVKPNNGAPINNAPINSYKDLGRPNNTTPNQNTNEQVYRGTATTTVQLSNIYGASKGNFTYKTEVQVVIGPPKKSLTNMSETNPFSLWLQSKPLVNAAGEISIASALPANGAIFQYWQFSGNDNNWQGVLNDNHTREALALNLITLPMDIAPNLEMPNSVAMINGTKMTGQINVNQLKIIVEGNSTGGNTLFQTEIIAQRVQ
jgi:hypothetical protein